MIDSVLERRLFSLAELNHLRMEAMNIFEQCLTNGDKAPMLEFIERQLLHNPPRLQLLRELADDLQQRLLSLREYHFDVRDRVIRTLTESYGVDISHLSPPSELNRYHHLTTTAILEYLHKKIDLEDNDRLLLQKMIDASLQMAAQLHNDIVLTDHLYNLVVDWVEAMSVQVIKQHWNQTPQQPSSTNSSRPH